MNDHRCGHCTADIEVAEFAQDRPCSGDPPGPSVWCARGTCLHAESNPNGCICACHQEEKPSHG